MNNEQDFFKNACRIHTDSLVLRYLESNTDGRQDEEHASYYHTELCKFYVAAVRGNNDPESVQEYYADDFNAVLSKTQELTQNLEEEIDFPPEGRLDYDTLKLSFFEDFHYLAMAALLGKQEQP